ncbi:MAG TPA: hypothetical protein VFP50_15075 [Anaeromyxobacteraceae bacterium]|nr:hypothetical protein [Anaeromyxobacteraceae bacterium]
MSPALVAVAALLAAAPTPPRSDDAGPLRALDALVGTWDAEGGGAPGKGAGTVAFAREVDGHALVRRNAVTYPAAEGRPASSHEDLLVLYAEGGKVKGLYVDGEGHVIRYAAAPSAPGTLVLLSEAGPGPRFRLTHDWSDPSSLRIAFEIAPPGSTEFKAYASGRATRRPGT